jgi:hypothetical protein
MSTLASLRRDGSFFSLVLAGLLVGGGALSEPSDYEQAFFEEVVEFANLNRMSIARLNRDVHADCYILVTATTTINRDGTVKDIAIVETSSVPVVDRYYRYVIEQAAPYQPLEKFYDPVPLEVTITQTFKLDVRLWSDGVRSTRECDKLEPRTSPPD